MDSRKFVLVFSSSRKYPEIYFLESISRHRDTGKRGHLFHQSNQGQPVGHTDHLPVLQLAETQGTEDEGD